MRALVNENRWFFSGPRFVFFAVSFVRNRYLTGQARTGPLDTFVMVLLLARCEPDALTSWIASI
jgi:hypothetical protein